MNETSKGGSTATAGPGPNLSSESPIAVSEVVQEAVRRVLPSMIEEKLRQVLPSIFEEGVRELMPCLVEDLAEEYGLSTEVAGLLHLAASKSNDRHEDLLRKALTLYNVALDARDNGNRLAILNPEDIIVREIVGVETSDLHPQPVGH
jgi:hypothetical protein